MNAQEQSPGELIEMSGSYWKTFTLHAGVKLDVFTVLDNRSLSAEAVAGKLAADARATEMLLNALAAMDLLEKKGGVFSNTSVSSAFLSKSSPRYAGYIILHHHHLADSWAKLDQAVTTGQAVRSPVTFSDEEQREAFLMGMFNMAMSIAPLLIKKVNLSGRRHLLDLGGGPGTYAILFCQANPGLKATVYDLPTTRPFAEKTFSNFKMSDRIQFTAGDYTEGNIEGSYDVAWLSQILHAEPPAVCRQIIGKAAAVLEPGGMLIVHEFILNNKMDGPLFPALFSLNMLLGTDGGQSYSEQQISEMMTGAGLVDIRRISFESPNDSGIITGIVPS